MPARFDIVLKYIQGKKYQQILKKMNKNDTIEEYRKFLETSTKKNHELEKIFLVSINIVLTIVILSSYLFKTSIFLQANWTSHQQGASSHQETCRRKKIQKSVPQLYVLIE